MSQVFHEKNYKYSFPVGVMNYPSAAKTLVINNYLNVLVNHIKEWLPSLATECKFNINCITGAWVGSVVMQKVFFNFVSADSSFLSVGKTNPCLGICLSPVSDDNAHYLVVNLLLENIGWSELDSLLFYNSTAITKNTSSYSSSGYWAYLDSIGQYNYSPSYDLGGELPVPVTPSNWYNMYLLDKKVHDTNVGKYIEVTHPTTLQKTIIPIVGGFLVAAGGKIGGVAQASEPLRDFTNKVNPGTYSTIKGVAQVGSFNVGGLTDSIARLKAAADQVLIDNLKKEQMIQKTYQEIGTLMAEGSFVYTWVGSALHDALGFVSQYGRKILRLSTFMALCSSADGTITMDGTQYTYKVKDGKGSETSANDFIHQATEDATSTSNQEANSGTTTQADKDADAQSDKEANESIKSAMNSVKKVFDNWYAKLVAGLTLGTFGIDQATKLGIDLSGLANSKLGIDTTLLDQLLQGKKLGLNLDGLQSIIDGQGIKVDPSNLTGQNIGIDPSGLSGQKVGIDTTGATIDTHVSGNVNVNLNAPDSINLNAPESIQLDTTGAKMEIDPLSLEGINSLSDSYKTYAEKIEVREQARMTREDIQETRKKAIEDQQKKLVDNDVGNIEANNTNLGYKIKINKSESSLRESDFEDGVNYEQAQRVSWKNKDSQETYSQDGVTLKKGLNSNPQVNQAVDINKSILTHVTMKGLEGLSDKLAVLRPQEGEVEKVIRRFADVNPSMRYDFGGIISKINIPESEA